MRDASRSAQFVGGAMIHLLNVIAPHLRDGLVGAGLFGWVASRVIQQVVAIERDKAGEGKHGRR